MEAARLVYSLLAVRTQGKGDSAVGRKAQEGAANKSELSRRQKNARRMSRAGQKRIESKETRERKRDL